MSIDHFDPSQARNLTSTGKMPVGPTAKMAVLHSPELDFALAIACKGALAIPRKH
jgi:hypothetical protein